MEQPERVRLVPYLDSDSGTRPVFTGRTVEDALGQAMDYNWVLNRYPGQQVAPVIAQRWDRASRSWAMLDLEAMVHPQQD